MKMESNGNKIASSVEFTKRNFGIQNDNIAHILDIVRNRMYKNKVLAVIREYSTNAQDAHVEAGTPEKEIKVTLPTKLSQNFKVRDYGNGLSEEEIFEVYIQYGSSTKRMSNAFNGQLGLGSKAGFAYSNTFQVTSFHNGMKTVYQAIIDESNLGAMNKLVSVASDEPSGIEISVPVRSEDIKSFVSTAHLFYSTFNPKPKGVGTHKLNKPSLKVDNVSLFSEGMIEFNYSLVPNDYSYGHRHYDSHYNISRLNVLMGNVLYPFEKSDLSDRAISEMRSVGIDNANIVIVAPIGAVSISSSRENLELTDKTKKYISDQMIKFVGGITEEVKKKNTAISTPVEHIQLYHELSKSRLHSMQNKLTYKNNPITTSIFDGQYRSRAPYKVYTTFAFDTKNKMKPHNGNFNLEIPNVIPDSSLRAAYCSTGDEYKFISLASERGHKVVFAYHNKKTIRISDRLKKYSDDNGGNHIFCVFSPDKSKKGQTKEEFLKENSTWIDADQIIDLADMPAPKIKRTVSTPGVKRVKKKNLGYKNFHDNGVSVTATFEPDEKSVFFPKTNDYVRVGFSRKYQVENGKGEVAKGHDSVSYGVENRRRLREVVELTRELFKVEILPVLVDDLSGANVKTAHEFFTEKFNELKVESGTEALIEKIALDHYIDHHFRHSIKSRYLILRDVLAKLEPHHYSNISSVSDFKDACDAFDSLAKGEVKNREELDKEVSKMKRYKRLFNFIVTGFAAIKESDYIDNAYKVLVVSDSWSKKDEVARSIVRSKNILNFDRMIDKIKGEFPIFDLEAGRSYYSDKINDQNRYDLTVKQISAFIKIHNKTMEKKND